MIWVQYHPSETDPTDFRVVGVVVYPMSRAYKYNAQDVPNCGASSQHDALRLAWDTETKVAYTYDVRFTVPLSLLRHAALCLLTPSARCCGGGAGGSVH